MNEIMITFPDGSTKPFPANVTPVEVASSLGERLAKACLAAEVDGEILELNRPIARDATLRLLTFNDKEGQEVYRHSAAHIMAQAVQRLFPDAKVTIGPPIESGFYYDFDVSRPFTPEDLGNIEKVMKEIVAEDQNFERVEVSRDEAATIFGELQEPYKLEILEAIPAEEKVTLYRNGNQWLDLCRGPHVPSTGKIKAIKLLSTSGAYWRGDEKNRMLQRIYGTSYPEEKQLKEHLERLEEAQRRDHRRLGRELDLFMLHPIAPASPFFFPKGAIIYNELIGYVRELYEEFGYEEVITPQIFSTDLWKTSGHYDHYVDNMFFTNIDDREYGVKPMNCPGHCLMYAANTHSYRDLPVRYADFGRLHRYERSGVTQGLTRVRTFAQDDAHIFCRPDQIEQEINGFFEMVTRLLAALGFELVTHLSTRPEKRAGTDAMWDEAERVLEGVLEKKNIEFRLEPGEGAFYGPKIDIFARDILQREWQLSTVQLDYALPDRFGLEYVTAEGAFARPVMVHRTVLGSIERFLGILIEQFGGAFPTWLAPVQVILLPIADRHHEYTERLRVKLRKLGLRAEADFRSQKTGAKVAEAETRKIPYMLVVGDREVAQEAVSVRAHGRRDLGSMNLESFIEQCVNEIAERKMPTSQ